MKTTLKLITICLLAIALLAIVPAPAVAQTALSTTTLGAPISDANGTTITLTSTSTMQNPGPANRINTCFYVDKELFGVTNVIDSTHVTVGIRGSSCGAVGAASRPTFHASGALVYFANTSGSGTFVTPAAAIIGKNFQPTAENFGSCIASSELSLPRIYLYSGDIFDCKRVGAAGTSGQWIYVGNGTMAVAGGDIRAFCTGTVGSAQGEFLNGAACSGATAATARYVVKSTGTLANFYAFSSASFLGTGSSTFTVLKNGTATAIVCPTAATTSTCTDLLHSVAVTAGDVVTFSFLSATSDTAANLSVVLGIY